MVSVWKEKCLLEMEDEMKIKSCEEDKKGTLI